MLFQVPCFLPKVLHKFQGPTGTQHCSHPKVLPGHPTVTILEYCRISHYSHRELLAFVACGVSFVFPNQRTLVILHNHVQDLQNAVQLLQNASWMKLSDIFLIIRLRISERKTRGKVSFLSHPIKWTDDLKAQCYCNLAGSQRQCLLLHSLQFHPVFNVLQGAEKYKTVSLLFERQLSISYLKLLKYYLFSTNTNFMF